MKLETLQTKLTESLRADKLHSAAKLIVEARTEHFLGKDGNPDYAGHSYSYRQWYSEVINSLGLPQDERRKLLGNMRFHVGNELRSIVPASELEDAGLLAVSPKQRGQMNYKGRSRPHQLFNSRTRLHEEDEIHQVSEYLENLARRLDPSEMAESSRSELEKAVRHLLARATR